MLALPRSLVVAAAGLTVLAGACSTGSKPDREAQPPPEPAAEPSCGSGGDRSGPTQDRTLITADGRERSYVLAVPSSYQEDTPAPVLFNLHGAGSTAAEQYAYAGFTELAERDGVILVMPQALETDQGARWNGRLPDPSEDFGFPADDVDFLDQLAESLATEYCVADFWTTGMSSGGLMSSALACEADVEVEGLAPVTLSHYLPEPCAEAPPRRFVYFHGTDDGVVPFDGVPERGREPAMVTAQEWAVHNGCDPDPVEGRIGDEVRHLSWAGCEAATDFYVIEGGVHTWPGSFEVAALGYTTQQISATEVIWDAFFG